MIVPFDVTTLAIDTIERAHAVSLAALERDKGLPPRTIPPLSQVGHLAGEGFRRRYDTPPVALVGTFGTVNPPERSSVGTLHFDWTLAVEVTVVGQDRGDTIKRRDWYGMTVAECLVWYMPRSGTPIDAVALEDVDLASGADADSAETEAVARLLFGVVVRNTLAIAPPFPTIPDDPYAAPLAAVQATKVSTNVLKEPLS